jgi:hypothetical protein
VTRPGRLPRTPPPTETGHRAPIGPHTLRAAYDAHQSDTHAGTPDPDCFTCASYLHGLADAATTHDRTRP